ncbi:IS66 Orf2 like protein [Cyclonatronum proteinivorum]|uniref:IS66 Orf2 like protein n=1 Tax=Cyclonatronum proteinivorum TaxID=1457365 RepID=A0A345UGB1_9BACT|nr:IS66 family insertion sequence element accessory protein TnpB [Cyclonatronum proteinivorum]AXI99512.1 IS66 Orf2 like protein [Cyclonatronum proteinivorum]AXJ00646.1 IS66 Orf2 like protein [Cyclonatronum proteinivorum]AXJ01299.1 IS66 Orf2 like protein [Cyclonatronum proteinivorum]
MFGLNSTHTYHLYRKACDMRKSFDGLSGLVRNELGREPASGDVFVFVNRSRTLIKLLQWQSGGYVLYYKRLEQGTFAVPALGADTTRIRWPELVVMIEGIKVEHSGKLPCNRLKNEPEQAGN